MLGGGHEQKYSVALGQHFTSFIDSQLETGCYGSASEVIRSGLRLLEEYEARVKALQNALIAGLESGDPEPFDSESFLQRMQPGIYRNAKIHH